MGSSADRRLDLLTLRRPRVGVMRAALALAVGLALAAPVSATAISTSALTITPSATVITWGQTVVLNMDFGTAGANRIIVLESSRDTLIWENVYILTTNNNGIASWPYRPATNRYYRATFQGAADLAATRSGVVRVVVRQVLLLKPTSGGKTTIVNAGRQVTFSLSVRPSRPELLRTTFTVAIYRMVSGRWQRFTARDIAVGTYGDSSITWTFATRGEWYVRAIANPTPDNANSVWSQIERYSVR